MNVLNTQGSTYNTNSDGQNRARASSATLCSVHVLRVFLCFFSLPKGSLIPIKTVLDTYLIRIQTRTPLSRYPPYDYSNLARTNFLSALCSLPTNGLSWQIDTHAFPIWIRIVRGERPAKRAKIRNGPSTVSESTVSNTELSEFFGAH